MGSISYETFGSKLVIDNNADITAKTNLTIKGQDIELNGPNKFYAENDVVIYPAVNVMTANDFLIKTNGSIFLHSDVTTGQTLDLQANSDCVGDSVIFVHSSVTLEAAGLNIRGSGIHIDGSLDIGSGALLFEERCAVNNSVGVGGSSFPVSMHISEALLGRISAQFSPHTYITFSSLLGSVEIENVLQDSMMASASTARIAILSQGNTSFTGGANSFHTLEVRAGAGISQYQNVSTYSGQLLYNFTNEDLIISTGVDITSADGIVLSGNGEDIIVESPTRIEAVKDLVITSPILVSGDNNLYLHSNQSVILFENVAGVATIDIEANSDCLGSDMIMIHESSTISGDIVNIRGNYCIIY